ncbi:MAG: haloacid dehalogenase [Thermomicrobiales bacterium]
MANESSLTRTLEAIVGRFEETSAARDRALTEGRHIVRLSANSIRAVHRGDFDEADELIGQAGRLLSELTERLQPHPNVYWAGYVQDAMKEYAEAIATRAFVLDCSLLGPNDLGVEDAPYLNALAEAASELRREVLDALRRNDVARAERLLSRMDDVYDILVSVDFPDAVTGGLRRATDQLRAVLERTRGDVTITLTQQRLEGAIKQAQARFDDRP